MGKATEVNERHGKFQSSFQKYEEVLEKEQEHAQFDLDDEWCNILEICEPGSDDDENTSDNKNNEMKSWEQIDLVKEEDTKADEIYHQIEKEKRTESDAKKSMKQKQKKNILSKKRSNLIQEETWETYDKNPDKTVSSTKNKDNHTTQKKKITKRQKTSNNKIIKSRMKQVINNVLEHDNNKIVIDSEEDNSNITEPSKLSKPGKCPKKLKEKWHSSKTKSVPVPATRNIEVNGIKEEAEKSQNIFKTVIQKSAALELNVQSIPIEKPKKKRKEANKKDKSASQPAAHQPGIKIDNNMSNLVDKIKPARGRPKKIRASGESMDATIEAVVRNSLLKYEESLVNARNESCKEIDLADLPLSQVHKLRKELKRSIFIQRKKEQYKEIFKKKKMNGTLKLKAKNTRIVMAKSFKKWKDFKIKRNKDQKENKTSITNRKPKIAGTCCKKNRLNKKKPALVSMEKQMASKLASVPLEKQIVSKPSPVTLEEQMASKPSPYHKHHIPLDQASYTYFDSDIARPSRHIVRPVRYLDFMKQSTENLAIMRLHQDGDKSMLPYDMENLDWNHDHSENTQAIYCYCGESGSWHTKMVRCSRCDQWFHERCLAPRPFAMPIISGDSFWLFVCSMCNIGSECLKRMDLTWTDLVHLAIFDLTSKTNRKFHDFDNDLMPFMLKNWAFFQLYKHFNSLTDEEKKLKTKETLFKSETFEQGSEAGQQEGIWGLRHYLPPPRPIYKVPDIGIISERTVLDEASVSSTVHPEPEPFLGIYNNFNIIYKDYVKPVVPEKPKKCIIKKKLTLKKSTQVNGCSSQVISHKNIQKSLKNKANVRSCKVKFKCLKLPEELKEMLTENCQKSKIEEKKPLPYEISKTLHQKGYPKVAMKFAEIIPPKKAIVVQALKAEQKSKKKRGPKSKKILDNHIPGSVEEKESSSDTSESSVLDALIPVKLDYYGENNPFILGSIEEQRAARNLICNRKLKEEDLTKCRSRIRKRKHRLFIEESRQLWKSKELVLENVSTQGQKNCVEEANQDLQYAGKYTTPSGEIKLLLLNPEKAEDESQMIDTKAYEQ